MVTSTDIQQMRESLKQGIDIVSVPQLFTTPKELAVRIAELCLDPIHYGNEVKGWNRNSFRILEPSAGTGMLVGALGSSWHPDGELVAIEINTYLSNRLEAEFPLTKVLNKDFLEVTDIGLFDRVVMNPPFVHASDIRHIKHALNFLKPEGRLIAICANGPRQHQQLRPLAEDSGGFWESLPEGTFLNEGTNVRTALLVIEN